jgi:hypothetical protein
MPRSPDAPYALATVHLRRGDPQAARAAAGKALAIDAGYAPALNLLQSLDVTRQGSES